MIFFPFILDVYLCLLFYNFILFESVGGDNFVRKKKPPKNLNICVHCSIIRDIVVWPKKKKRIYITQKKMLWESGDNSIVPGSIDCLLLCVCLCVTKLVVRMRNMHSNLFYQTHFYVSMNFALLNRTQFKWYTDENKIHVD